MAFIEKNVNGVVFTVSTLLRTPHAFTTRLGGVSSGIFSSLDLAENRGDDSVKKQPVRRAKKPGRNDPCPCGKLRPNGLPMKYKDCCGRNE